MAKWPTPWRRLPVLLCLLAATGCSSISPLVASSLLPKHLDGAAALNAYWHQRLPLGRAILLSAWSVSQGKAATAAQPLDLAIGLGPLSVELAADPSHRALVLERLHDAGEGCDTLLATLQQSAIAARPLFDAWFAGQALPRVQLEFLPPFNSSLGSRISIGRVEALHMYIAKALGEDTSCEANLMHAAGALGTVAHELLHFHSRVNANRFEDEVQDEFVAYSMSECMTQAIVGSRIKRSVRFHGLDERSAKEILQLSDSRRIPATAAGKVLAYRHWQSFAGRPAEYLRFCQGLQNDYPNPREIRFEEPGH